MSDGPGVPMPNWPTPPTGGWTADDLDRIPNLPPHTEVAARFTIDIDRQNRPEPDVIVVHGEVIEDWNQTRFPAASVVLAIEVVSTDSVTRDRETKPLKYARAKIPHYWRVEDNEGQAVVHVFELEPTTGAYTSTGIFHDRMKVSVPFPVDLDLDQIKLRRIPAADE